MNVIYLHFCILLQLMEEYDWGEFAVITSLLPGYDTFVDIVESYTDTSYFLWNLQDILTLEMSVGTSEAKAKRLLQQVQSDAGLALTGRGLNLSLSLSKVFEIKNECRVTQLKAQCVKFTYIYWQ